MTPNEVHLTNGSLTVSLVSDGSGDFEADATAHVDSVDGSDDVDLRPQFNDRAFRRSIVVSALLVAGAPRHSVKRSDLSGRIPGEYDTAMLRTKGMAEVDDTPVTFEGSPDGVRYGLIGLRSTTTAYRYLARNHARHGVAVTFR